MFRMRRVGLAITTVVLVVGGCTSGASPTPSRTAPSTRSSSLATPTPKASFSLADALRDRGQARLSDLLGGATAPPINLNWEDVENRITLPTKKQHAICQALDVPHADDVLSSLIFVGLNALSERFRHRPLNEDGEKVLEVAIGFVAKTCPYWVPKAAPQATPRPNWFPDGYQTVIGLPDVAWTYRRMSQIKCGTLESRCTELLLIARDGCPFSLSAAVVFKDDAETVVDTDSRTETFVPALKTQILHFGTIRSDATKVLASNIFCV